MSNFSVGIDKVDPEKYWRYFTTVVTKANNGVDIQYKNSLYFS